MERPNPRRGLSTRWESRERSLYIPEELVVNILPSLPMEALLRFRCVSKQWRCLISETKKKEKLMCTMIPNHPEKLLYIFFSVDTEKKLKKVCEHESEWDHCTSIMGSCNGLLLIGEHHDLFLWNPTIRYCRKVLSYHRLGEDDYGVVSGLCFDSHNNDYKVVLMLAHQTPSYGSEFVVVASCKTKIWMEIYFPYKYSSVGKGPLFNNYLHWYATPEGSSPEYSYGFMSPHCIIYFDVATDKFARLPMPVPIESDGDQILGLGVLDGCLCMARFEQPGNSEGTAQVMVMRDYGVKESWTVLFRVEGVRSWRSLDPFFYCENNGEVLLRVSKIGDLVVAYDIIKKSSTEIANFDFQDTVLYEETMVRPIEYGRPEEGVSVEKYLDGETRLWKLGMNGCWNLDHNLNK